MNHEQRRLFGENELAACGCNPDDTALVALSGGADSTALLLCMHDLMQEGRIRGLFAAHLNHKIRGVSALRDQRFCEEICQRLDIPLTVEQTDVPKLAKTTGQTLEQAARQARYAFLERARAACGASVILTAHHRDDQAETLLLHLIRGSGMNGLVGMKPRNGMIARPMLKCSRASILAFLAERGEPYCEDETNAENDATRNRVRNELLPLLETFNPSIAETLEKTAELLSQDEAYLSELADEAEQRIKAGDGLDKKALGDLPPPVGSRIVRKRLFSLNESVTNADIRRVLALATAQTGTVIELSQGYHAWTDARTIYMGIYPSEMEYAVAFHAQGETVTPDGTWVSEITNTWRVPKDGFEAYLDLEQLPRDLVVRSRRAGDRIFPLGAPGERKLSDVFTDKKIAREKRDLPLLAAGNEIYFACGVTISERAKITPETREILHIICYRGTRD